MKLTIDHKILAPIISDLAAVARGPSPSARAIRITIQDNAATFASGDDECWLERKIDCKAADASIAVDAPVLHSVIAGGFGSVVLEASDRLNIKMGPGKFKLFLIDPKDTRIKPTLKAESFLVSAEDLKSGLKTALAGIADKSEARAYMHGVHLFATKDALRFTASDGNRIAVVQAPLPEGVPEILKTAGVIIPPTACKTVLRLIDTGTVAVKVTESLIEFDCGDSVLTSKLIGAEFPLALVEKFTKLNLPTVMEFGSADLLASINRIMPLADHGGMNGGRAMHFRALHGKVTLSVVSDVGAAAESFETETPKALSLGFNAVSLKAALSCGTGTAKFEFHEDAANNPCRLTLSDRADLTWILAAVRVNEPMMAEAA